MVYLDNNSTTAMDERVKKVYCDATKLFGNVNVIYQLGIDARAAMNEAYDILYPGIGASDEDDILITSSTTEGNNTVIKTFIDAYLKGSPKKHIITTISEHSYIKSSYTFWSVKFVCAECKIINSKLPYINLNFPYSLSTVTVKRNRIFSCYF